MPVKTKLKLLNLTITFDVYYARADIERYRNKLLKQLESLPAIKQISNDVIIERQLIYSLAEKRLHLVESNREALDRALEMINKFNVNYSHLSNSQAVDASRVSQLIKFEALLKQVSPSLNTLYATLKISIAHPEISTAITKKLKQLNQLAKRQKMDFLDQVIPSAKEDALRYRLTKNDMDILIARKKEKYQLNCHVIDGDNPCSITNFLENVRKNGQRRTQLIYKIAGTEHWSTIDIGRNEQGILSIFFLDSIGHATNLPKIVSFCTQHRVKLTMAMGGLQKDFSSCSIFGVDQAFQLSKIEDLHERLSALRKPSLNAKNTFEVNTMDLAPELVKNAQSSSYIKNYLEKHHEYEATIINKKNQTLFKYAESHHLMVDNQKTYRAINYKQSQYRKKINLIKGYEEDSQYHSKIIINAQKVFAQATREIQAIKINIPSTTLDGITFYYQALLQQIEEVRTSRAARDAQTILNIRQAPLKLTNVIRLKQNELLQAVYNGIIGQPKNEALDSPVIKSKEAIALQNRCQILTAMNFNKYLTLFKRKFKLLDESTSDKTNDLLLMTTKELCANLGQLKRNFLLENLDSPVKQLHTDFIQKYRTILQTAQDSLKNNKDWNEAINKCFKASKANISKTPLQKQSLFANTKTTETTHLESENSNESKAALTS